MKWTNLVSSVRTWTIVRTLEVLRQPREDKLVTINRALGSLIFPACLLSPALDFCGQA
jgi:hypothetical protein